MGWWLIMRMIDGDALLRKICGDSCGCEPDQCGHLDEYRHNRCKAGQYVANAPTINGWISVKDRLPENYKAVLTCDKYGMIHENWLLATKTGVSWSIGYHITHWMPFPEPPKEDD